VRWGVRSYRFGVVSTSRTHDLYDYLLFDTPQPSALRATTPTIFIIERAHIMQATAKGYEQQDRCQDSCSSAIGC
jgi:hypothetical protein